LTPGSWNGKALDDHDAKLPVDIQNVDGVHFTATPGLYWVNSNDGQQQTMRWPFIYHWFSHDIYLSLADPITTVWAQPKMFAKGQVETANNMFRMTYNGFKMVGKPGQLGTKFVADIELQFDGKTFHPSPSLTITGNGPQDELVQSGPDFYVSMSSMDAATGGANLQVYFAKPIYQMELFYKPMTSLVWLGAGILSLGGLMAAFYRRPRSKGSEPDDSTVENTES
jgi:hypothetical protein